ncbi:hypothetical protein [Cumulibacter manganitolerans]|uniref:hypothetical protein n=1 Tax=Cumulibacter manganitolerans TaxID=1884992 RepID=UPI001297C39A|nr:hypothetical protein [Cumulibacter manganitolerans]
MTTPLPDLAGALARKPPKAKPQPVADLAKDAPAPPVDRTVARVQTGGGVGPRQPRISRRRKAVEAAPDVVWTRTIGYNLPRDVHARAKERARAEGVTLTTWLLEAVNAHHASLGERLEPAPVSASGLFAIPQHRGERSPATQSTMRVTDQQFTAIEELANQLGTNRSALLAVAAEAALDEQDDAP